MSLGEVGTGGAVVTAIGVLVVLIAGVRIAVLGGKSSEEARTTRIDRIAAAVLLAVLGLLLIVVGLLLG